MIVRLYVMYQQSRKMLIFLILTFLVLTILSVVFVALFNSRVSGGELN